MASIWEKAIWIQIVLQLQDNNCFWGFCRLICRFFGALEIHQLSKLLTKWSVFWLVEISKGVGLFFFFLCRDFLKNRELYWSNLPQDSNLGQESFVQKSGVRISVGEGQIFCHFSFFLYLFHFVHKKLNIKTYTTFFVYYKQVT